jgi:hypothetical protein
MLIAGVAADQSFLFGLVDTSLISRNHKVLFFLLSK